MTRGLDDIVGTTDEPIVAILVAFRQVAGHGTGGACLTDDQARELAGLSHLMLICGHYEGVDDRINYYIDGMLSMGDYILTGGEIPALAVADAVVRLLSGVLGGEGSAQDESFQTGLLEYPHYTRPREFEGHEVPQVLLEGNHRASEAWRRQEALRRTLARRPDLLAKAKLSPADRKFIESLALEPEEDR